MQLIECSMVNNNHIADLELVVGRIEFKSMNKWIENIRTD